MKREDITVLAQLLTALKDAISRLETADNEKKVKDVVKLKKEILHYQAKIKEIVG